jgi:hypothetical protein
LIPHLDILSSGTTTRKMEQEQCSHPSDLVRVTSPPAGSETASPSHSSGFNDEIPALPTSMFGDDFDDHETSPLAPGRGSSASYEPEGHIIAEVAPIAAGTGFVGEPLIGHNVEAFSLATGTGLGDARLGSTLTTEQEIPSSKPRTVWRLNRAALTCIRQ